MKLGKDLGTLLYIFMLTPQTTLIIYLLNTQIGFIFSINEFIIKLLLPNEKTSNFILLILFTISLPLTTYSIISKIKKTGFENDLSSNEGLGLFLFSLCFFIFFFFLLLIRPELIWYIIGIPNLVNCTIFILIGFHHIFK